jgi:hypothetical protein
MTTGKHPKRTTDVCACVLVGQPGYVGVNVQNHTTTQLELLQVL